MNVIGKDAGKCIHCYEHEGKRLCSVHGGECNEKYEDYCIDFIPRHKFSAKEIDNEFVSDYKARYGLLKPI